MLDSSASTPALGHLQANVLFGISLLNPSHIDFLWVQAQWLCRPSVGLSQSLSAAGAAHRELF